MRDELAAVEDLAAPHASGLSTIDRAGQADHPSWASGTQGLRELQIRRCFREPQVGIVHLARQLDPETRTCRVGGLRSARSSTGGSPAITPRSRTR